MENWKDINGYEGLYQVSTLGRVRSYDRIEVIANRWGGLTERTKKGKIIAQTICANNYYYSCMLHDDEGNPKRILVHRLVAAAFKARVNEDDVVNHKDGDKLNNVADNLEWCTRSENMIHAISSGLSSNAGGRHYRARKVIDTSNGVLYGSIKEAALKAGYTNVYLKAMLAGRNKNITTLQYA